MFPLPQATRTQDLAEILTGPPFVREDVRRRFPAKKVTGVAQRDLRSRMVGGGGLRSGGSAVVGWWWRRCCWGGARTTIRRLKPERAKITTMTGPNRGKISSTKATESRCEIPSQLHSNRIEIEKQI